MPKKEGAGGKPQEYDAESGRYGDGNGSYRQNTSYSEILKADERKEQNNSYQPDQFKKAVENRLKTEKNKLLKARYWEYLSDLERESGISQDMQDIVKQIGSELLGFEFRLKNATKERFYQKVAEDPTKRNKDNVRYTVKLGEGVEEYHKTVSALQKRGYKPVAVKNYWLSNGYYKGINTNWESPEGTIFEIQFHSADNLKVKDELHPWYEKWRQEEPKSDKANEYEKKQWEISKKFIKPKRIEEVK